MMAIHFIRPFWLWMILPQILLLWLVMKKGSVQNAWNRVCDPHLLPHLLVNNRSHALRSSSWALGISWILALVALAGPSWTKNTVPVYAAARGRVIVLDLSMSMNARDIKPSRLVRSKYKVMDILSRTREGQVGMVVFSQESFTVSPLTEDAATVLAMISELSPDIMPIQGTADVASGIRLAQALLQGAGVGVGDVVLLTSAKPSSDAFTQARALRRAGFRLLIMGVGTKGGAPIPEERGGFVHNEKGAIQLSQLDSSELQSLAKAGGGAYVTMASNDKDIDQLLPSNQKGAMVQTDRQATIWQDQGWWLLFGILPLVIYGFRRSILAVILS